MTLATQLRMRTYAGEADATEIVRVVNAASAADRVEEIWTAEALVAWLGHASEQFDPARDVVVAELDGRVVATGRVEWVDTRDGLHREYRICGSVDPAFAGTGDRHGAARRARGSGACVGRRATAGSGRRADVVCHRRALGEDFLRGAGYETARWFIDMVRPDLEGIVEPPLPEGLEIRPVTSDQYETIWRANREAFRDHWGGSDESLEQLQRILGDPDTDPSLWLVAWDGDEVAGGVWNDIYPAENEAHGIRRGWLGSVFTRRPWRKRGLASALIGRSLTLLRERGMTTAILGVDADNPTGALGLYESAGFAVHDRFVGLRKPMEVPS